MLRPSFRFGLRVPTGAVSQSVGDDVLRGFHDALCLYDELLSGSLSQIPRAVLEIDWSQFNFAARRQRSIELSFVQATLTYGCLHAGGTLEPNRFKNEAVGHFHGRIDCVAGGLFSPPVFAFCEAASRFAQEPVRLFPCVRIQGGLGLSPHVSRIPVKCRKKQRLALNRRAAKSGGWPCSDVGCDRSVPQLRFSTSQIRFSKYMSAATLV